MEHKIIEINGLDHLESSSKEVLKFIENSGCRVIAFYGEMGAGKTTLIRQLCRLMGVKETVNSPSFAIVNQYEKLSQNQDNEPELINHFDFYRIKNIEEAFDFGYQEYFYSGEYCFVEWPELISEILPENTLKIEITTLSPDKRKVEMSY